MASLALHSSTSSISAHFFSVYNSKLQKGYWTEIKNQRKYFDELAEEFGVEEMEDWYEMRAEDVKNQGGRGVLSYHSDSLIKGLHSVYPGSFSFASFFIIKLKHCKSSLG